MATQTVDVSGIAVAAGTENGGRLAAYVTELREFFAVRGMKFGAPEDLEAFAAALRQPGTFADELGSMVRSVVYREQGTIAKPELLELMTVAMGGARIAEAAQQVREPVRELLAFLGNAARNGRGPALVGSVASTPNVVESSARVVEVEKEAAEAGMAESKGNGEEAVIGAEELVKTDPTVHPMSDLHRPHPTEFYARARSLSPDMERKDGVALHEEPEPAETDARGEGPLEKAGERIFTVKLPENDLSNDLMYGKPKTGPIQWQRALAISAVAALLAGAVILLEPWLGSVIGTRDEAAIAAMGPAKPESDAGSELIGGAAGSSFRSGSGAVIVPPAIDAKTRPLGGARGVDSRMNGEMSRSGVAVSGVADSDLADGVDRVETGRPGTFLPDANGSNSGEPGVLTDSNDGAGTMASGAMNGDRYSSPTRVSPTMRAMPSRRARVYTVSSGVMAGNLVSAPSPDYPRLAGLFHMEGQVILQAVVSRNGRVVATHVLRGHRLLRGAAEDAVRRWRYRPFYVNGQSTDVATIVTVNFRRR